MTIRKARLTFTLIKFMVNLLRKRQTSTVLVSYRSGRDTSTDWLRYQRLWGSPDTSWLCHMGWRDRLTSSELAGQSRNDNACNPADLDGESFRETQKSVSLAN